MIVGRRVFFVNEKGRLLGLDLLSGREVWRFEGGADATASPAVGEGRMVIGFGDGAVRCFGPRERKPQTPPKRGERP